MSSNNHQSGNKIRAAVVGAGYVSWYHARALKALDFIELVGVCDADQSKAEKMAGELGIPTVAKTLTELTPLKLDLIHILTPPASHCELTLQALGMGCHVLVEKPMAETEAECARMIAAAEQAGKVLSVNHSARLDPVVLHALELVKQGVCGDVLSVDFLRSSDYAPYGGGVMPAQYAKGGYPFQDIGVHGLYLVEAFLGEIRNVDAQYRSTGRHALLTFDEWHTRVECKNGVGHMYMSWNVQPMQNELIVHGTRGVMHVDCYLQTCTVRRRIPGPKPVQRLYAAVANSLTTLTSVTGNVFKMVTGKLKPSPGIYEGARRFAVALRDGTVPPVPAEEGRRIVAWAEFATKGADEAKRELTQKLAVKPVPARILVTGASGFLGGALLARLVREGESPRILLRKPSAKLEALSGAQPVYGDLGNPADVDRAVAGVDLVYHVGAAMGGGAADFECATVWGTRNVIEACLKHGVKKLVHVSSLSVLDHAGHRKGETVTEASAFEPHPEWRGQYTRTKLIAEQLVSDAIRESKLPAVILRPGMIFGPNPKQFAPSGSIGVGSRWIVMGGGRYPLPLIYVEDVVDALLLAATKEKALGQSFQLVDDATVTQKQYIEFARRSDSKLKASYVPKIIFFSAAIAAEILGKILKRSAPLSRYKLRSLPPLAPFDTSAAKHVLGWTAKVGVDEGLRRTFPETPGVTATSQPAASKIPTATN